MIQAPFPIPYQGSKRKLAPAILSCVPVGTSRLVEPFCGSAAVSLFALANGRVQSVWLNDSNVPLAELWSAIIARPDAVVDKYRELWRGQLGREREFYDAVRSNFNRTHEPELLLYLLARCVKAAVRYNSNGDFEVPRVWCSAGLWVSCLEGK
ncbi:MAG: DNA adenine methylase, partial [Ilumatobacteraceae bacterium]